jgi:hypothetical protein
MVSQNWGSPVHPFGIVGFSMKETFQRAWDTPMILETPNWDEFQDCSAICVRLRHLNPLLITLGGVHKLPKATPKITFSSWSLDHHGVSPLCFYQNYMEIMQEKHTLSPIIFL